MSEEEKLGFRADLKEALMFQEKSLFVFEGSKILKAECNLLIQIAKFCVEEPLDAMQGMSDLAEAVQRGEVPDGELLLQTTQVLFIQPPVKPAAVKVV